MSDNTKVLYVNDDHLDKVIYGGDEEEEAPKPVEPVQVVEQDVSVVKTEPEDDVIIVEETPNDDIVIDDEKVEPEVVVPEPEPEDVKVEDDEPVKVVDDDIEVVEVVEDSDADADADNNNEMSGGYDDDASSRSSDVSSLSTSDLLRVDPLYYRLTKFLQTGGDDGSEPQNVAEILKQINMNLEKMAQLMTKYVSQNEKQL